MWHFLFDEHPRAVTIDYGVAPSDDEEPVVSNILEGVAKMEEVAIFDPQFGTLFIEGVRVRRSPDDLGMFFSMPHVGLLPRLCEVISEDSSGRIIEMISTEGIVLEVCTNIRKKEIE